MGYINIYVSKPAQLSIKNRQLIIKSDEINTFPIEDINSVMLESTQTVLSTYVLKEFAANGIVAYVCDDKHTPNGIILPYNCHSRQSMMLTKQIDIGKSLKKQLWQQIVKSKIHNQAECIKLATGEICEDLYKMSKEVLSDDADNREAVAASLYFKRLFNVDFSRGQDNVINACLDYGYAILRGMIARATVVAGLNPNLGLHHKSVLNNFNLVDDLIEPFRPHVDLLVSGLIQKGIAALTPNVKKDIFALVNTSIEIGDKIQPIVYAIEVFVDSLVNSIKSGREQLILPSLINITMHKYE